ncbi:CRISPR-associated helicase Cas3' [Candidatus Contubernalis alkaliaceticus]|uniref:CRISPR-associated helicase Cas3' n=1 Tax=Candidatus Contubernalis alkaliaceticus TaxID=338645 RepID=UPI001F4C3478|nr:CRISPR-associated helicase Cas3' [Candidatus Contubernalis alkalaceticus]UNC93172.1 CRISPR-associated helicase Cas3' [Candidatus Contubernalis alkalaceticus]
MSVVKLEKCLARPAFEGNYLLTEHLEETAKKMGNREGSWQEKLKYLAGLVHDAGKARSTWQKYITKGGTRGEIVHSPLGSALFLFLAGRIVDQADLKGESRYKAYLMTVRLALDIANHHGRLADLEADYPPWSSHPVDKHIQECDFLGLLSFVEKKLNLVVDEEDFYVWLKKSRNHWQNQVNRAVSYVNGRMNRSINKSEEAAFFCLRDVTAGLIAADRYHAANLKEKRLQHDEADKALAELLRGCQDKAREAQDKKLVSKQMLKMRQEAQEEVTIEFKSKIDRRFFGLALPTGLGKTITALRLALEAAKNQGVSRIIYVAPYLSILSQAADEIAKITGLEVLQHHHLSLLEHEELDDAGFLALESWQSPVVAATFNQLFLALFPATAQQAMRIKGLEKSFVIIDEPQIINSDIWNMFLKQLKVSAERYDFKILFTSATIPPVIEGLGEDLVRFSPELELPDRYRCVFVEEKLDQELLAERIIKTSEQLSSTAAILNTVKDAYLVFREISKRIENNFPVKSNLNLFFLSGQMTPLHKARRIEEIRLSLKEGKPTIVVCTQILEAGVDLSFRKIFRAVPIIPSVAQTAGRANRHGEGPLSEVEVFIFLRDGEHDSSPYIYKCTYSREETLSILKETGSFSEVRTSPLVEDYYKRVFSRNPYTSSYIKLEQAALGNWSHIARTPPFEEQNNNIEVFVPWGEEYLTGTKEQLLQKFAPNGAEELYDKYLDKGFIHTLDFLERKKFMSLLNAFTLSLYKEDAYIIVDVTAGKQITKLKDISLYHEDSGLSYLRGGRDISARMH